jgi:pyridoxamine 5'-phosphate oxidase
MSIADLRRDYRREELSEEKAPADPIVQFRHWFDEALAAQALEVNAMALATVSPMASRRLRTVLLKAFGDAGFVFYTNYESAKARDLEANRARRCSSSGASSSGRCGSAAACHA